MTTANIGPLAPFRYTYESDSWWWSEQAYRIFGFSPSEVVPTTDLILRHQHPADVDTALSLARQQLAERRQVCLWHRIVDARNRVRQLLTAAEGAYDEAGDCVELRGWFVDVSRGLRVSYARDVDEAVRAAASTRDVIEQAKGVLMAAQGIGGDQAFEVLRACSQAGNVKVRDLATTLMAAVAQTGALPEPVLARLQDLRRGDPVG